MISHAGKWRNLALAAALGLSCFAFSVTGQDQAAESLKALRARADLGDAEAQFNLGLIYYKGQGVAQDYAEAARWYRKAADQGLAAAQNNIGTLYLNGHGVTQNYAEAARWLRKAADQGYAEAQYNLGLMYDDGQGVPQYYAEAARWYGKAADEGLTAAQNNLGTLCTSTATDCRKTTPKRPAGCARPPTRASLKRNTTSVPCTTRARV